MFTLLLAVAIQDPGWIDAHTHLSGKSDFDGAVEAALKAMDESGVQRALVLPPPQPPDFKNGYDCADFIAAVKKHPDRFAFLGGGGTLNAMIHRKDAGDVRAEFEKKAREILDAGAVGFGEMTAHHLSHAEWHPYEAAPPDHPLFLLLVDIAAERGVVIDFHMDAVAAEKATPAKFTSPNNPKTLAANVEAFERLLSHNRKAVIVWDHVGWDQTGDLSVKLLRSLLEKHENLMMSLVVAPDGEPANHPMTRGGGLKPDWLELLKDHSGRFVFGADAFHLSPKVDSPMKEGQARMRLEGARRFFKALPKDLADKIGRENPARIYKLR